MTTLVERAQVPARAATLRTLAGLEARRYARHPLFLIGAALMVWTTVGMAQDLANGTGDARILSVADGTTVPAFFLGVLGVFVGHRLTRSMARSREAVEASPADGVIRTAALCLACLVPGAVAMVWSPLWYVVYITVLCGVAASAAMIHEARGAQRSRLVRVWASLAVLAIVSLALAAASDPTRIPLLPG